MGFSNREGETIYVGLNLDQKTKLLPNLALYLALLVVFTSAFSFWPFPNNEFWRLLNPVNSIVLLWMGICVVVFMRMRKEFLRRYNIPHVSILAFLLVTILSLCETPDYSRSIIFLAKLAVMFLGAYSLFSHAISNARNIRAIYVVIVMAAFVSVAACLLSRFVQHSDLFGYHRNGFKYGTYIGILVPISCIYLFASGRLWQTTIGVILVLSAIFSCGTIGPILSIVTGLFVAVIIVRSMIPKIVIVVTLLLAAGVVSYMFSTDTFTVLHVDLSLRDSESSNVRQRYIEWQAELNILEDMTVTGTGAGCINEYRSEFYYRLPKSNELQAFDQNGYLAIAAETGIGGLVCFLWIIVHHFGILYGHMKTMDCSSSMLLRYNISNCAGLVAACVVNMFSSVFYNGVLIAFVLLLALIGRAVRSLPE